MARLSRAGRCRVRAADARRPSPLPPGRWRPAVTRPLAPRLPTPRGCGWPVQRSLALSCRSRSPSRALPAVASGDGAQTAPPLSSDLPRKDHRHLSGWTEPSVDSVRALGSIETTFHGSSRDLPATAHLVLAPTRKRSRAGPDDRGQDEARAVKAVDAPGWSRSGARKPS